MTPRPNVAILCHYDRDGALRSDTLRYLRELHAAGFWIVVVSNGTPMGPDGVAALRDVAGALLTRRNIGVDFSAWRMAMRRLSLPRPETRRILLINDSVYGPLAPLAPLLVRMSGADLWGMTDSAQRDWHLQSYFLLAGPRLIHAPVWRRFWRGVVPLPFRRWTVGRYEIGLSRKVVAAGLTARALFPYRKPGNPTLNDWRALLDSGFPFVKRELLRDNPTGETDLGTWRQTVQAAYAAEIAVDLRRY